MKNWQWFGHAQHLCVGRDCLWHLATLLPNGYLISSVGDWRPRHKAVGEKLPPAEDIGYGRKYESLVFRVIRREKCGCPQIDANEIDSLFANEHPQAAENHIRLCEKWAKAKEDKA